MSTFAIGAIINRTVSCMPRGTSYVNVGVWNGFTLLSGMIENPDKQCIGIDKFFRIRRPKGTVPSRFNEQKSANHRFYDIDYREYFANVHSGEIGFYIYDGNHVYEHQLMGLKLAEPFFAKNCVILVDDTNDSGPAGYAGFIDQSCNKYEILLDAKTRANCHPTFWNGVMIIRKC